MTTTSFRDTHTHSAQSVASLLLARATIDCRYLVGPRRARARRLRRADAGTGHPQHPFRAEDRRVSQGHGAPGRRGWRAAERGEMFSAVQVDLPLVPPDDGDALDWPEHLREQQVHQQAVLPSFVLLNTGDHRPMPRVIPPGAQDGNEWPWARSLRRDRPTC